jgi:hypothetical protein
MAIKCLALNLKLSSVLKGFIIVVFISIGLKEKINILKIVNTINGIHTA